jgi:hypothetical protein
LWLRSGSQHNNRINHQYKNNNRGHVECSMIDLYVDTYCEHGIRIHKNNLRIKHCFYPFIFLLSLENKTIYLVSQLNHQVIHLALRN